MASIRSSRGPLRAAARTMQRCHPHQLVGYRQLYSKHRRPAITASADVTTERSQEQGVRSNGMLRLLQKGCRTTAAAHELWAQVRKLASHGFCADGQP